MSEEQTEDAPAEESPQAESNGESKGTEFIDFDSLAPEVKARFDRIYSNMKQNERLVEPLISENRDLRNRLEKLETSDVQRSTDNAVASLTQQKAEAFEEGDYAKVAEIDNTLLDLKTQPSEQPRRQRAQPIEQQSAFTPEDAAAMQQWSNEANEDGSLKRPWTQSSHPLHSKAANIGAGVLDDPNIYGVSAVMKEIDRLMGVEQNQASRGVPSNLAPDANVPARRGSSPKLSDDEKYVARRQYSHLAAKEAEERYLQSKTKLGMA
jgi:hypothetical protein